MTTLQVLGVVGLGLSVGLTSTFLGIGGGLLIVPLLPMLMEVSIREVVATAQASVLFVVVLNTFNFSRHHRLPIRLLLPILIGAAISALAAAELNMILSDKAIAIGLFLLLWSLGGIIGFKVLQPEIKYFKSRIHPVFLFFVGLVAGGAGGFTGIGAGIIVTSFFVASDLMSPGLVVPSANLVMLFSTTCSVLAFSFAARGELVGWVRWDVAALIFFSSLMTSIWGGSKQHAFAPRARQAILVVVLFAASLQVINRYLS